MEDSGLQFSIAIVRSSQLKIAVMQPYFFPYMGYFELMASVDLFVFLDDVQYIRRGWVNRNRIRLNKNDRQYLTLPIKQCAQKTPIRVVECVDGWRQTVVSKLEKTYGAKLHPEVITALPAKARFLVEVIKPSLIDLARFLGIDCAFASSSGLSDNSGQQRILDICRHFGAEQYVNLSGGASLYDQEFFGDIKLRFMKPCAYPNLLSIVDALCESEQKAKAWMSNWRTSNEGDHLR